MEVIEQVSISLVICGSSEWHYTGYAFVDRNFGGPDDDLDESSFLYDQVNEDPIPSDCCGAEVIDANFPMWDCRAYYLSIVDHRSARVVKEWRVLVRLISRKIHSFVSMIYLSCLQQTHVRTHTISTRKSSNPRAYLGNHPIINTKIRRNSLTGTRKHWISWGNHFTFSQRPSKLGMCSVLASEIAVILTTRGPTKTRIVVSSHPCATSMTLSNL